MYIYIYTDRNEYLKLVPYFPLFVHHSGGRTDFQPREDEGSAKTAGGAYLDFEVWASSPGWHMLCSFNFSWYDARMISSR